MPTSRRHLNNPNYASVKCTQPMPGMIEISNSDDLEEISEADVVAEETPESIDETMYENPNVRLLKPLILKNQVSQNFNQNSNNDSESNQDENEKKNEKSDPEAGGDGAAAAGNDADSSEMYDYTNFETHPEDEDDDVSIHVYGVTHKKKAREPEDLKERMRLFLHSKPVHIAVIVLVIIDCILVIAEIIIDLRLVEVDSHSAAPNVLHYLSISILSIFMIEIALKLLVDWSHFIRHKIEVLDAVVVVVAFAVDVAVLFFEEESEAVVVVGLLVLLRLWRIVRLVNGIILTVKNECDERVHALKSKLAKVEEQKEKMRTEIKKLRHMLISNGIHVEPEEEEEEDPAKGGALMKLVTAVNKMEVTTDA